MTVLNQLSDLSGRRALITGASGGLGRVFADTLASLGADLILVDLPDTQLKEISSEIEKKHNVNVQAIECDLEKQDQRNFFDCPTIRFWKGFKYPCKQCSFSWDF